MKKSFLLMLSSVVLFGLTGCNQEVTPTAKYSVKTINATHLVVSNLTKTEYEVGEEVTFDVLDSDDYVVDYVKVYFDGLEEAPVTASGTHYTFTMPESNVTIKVSEKGAPYVEPKDEVTPVDLEALYFDSEAEEKDKLEWAILQLFTSSEVEPSLLKSATMDYNTATSASNATKSKYEAKVYNDFTTIEVETNGDYNSGYSTEQKITGYLEGKKYVYEYDKTTENFGDSSSYSTPSSEEKFDTYKVVKEGEEAMGFTNLSEEEAESKVHSSGFIDKLINEIFGAENNKTFFQSLDGTLKVSAPSLSEDGLTYTTTVTGIVKTSSWNEKFNKYDLSFTIDGDGFLHQLSFKNVYYKSGYDSENKVIKDDAVVDYIPSDYSVTFTRAADKNQGSTPLDLDTYFATTYDVGLRETKYGSSSSIENVTNYELTGNSTLNWYFTNVTGKPLCEPKFIGSKEEGGITEVKDTYSTKYEVTKVGELTLLFDNGKGDIKEVPVTVNTPEITSMDLVIGENGGSNFFIEDGKQKITATVLPVLAPQDVKIEIVKGEDIATISQEDGTYYVTPTGEGEVSIKATSTLNDKATITKNIAFTKKPTLEGVKAFITTHTIFLQSTSYSTDCGWINFNSDGTGSFIATQNNKPSSTYPAEDFKYVINEDFTFTITPNDGVDLVVNSYSFSDVVATSNSTLSIKFKYNDKDKGTEVKYMDRIEDLAKATKPN